jgi:hypothetical protein
MMQAAAASPSHPENQIMLVQEQRCSRAAAAAAWAAAAAFNPQAVVAALCQSGTFPLCMSSITLTVLDFFSHFLYQILRRILSSPRLLNCAICSDSLTRFCA